MKAAIFNPYLDTLGGGERYTMAIATALAKHGYIVDVEWSDPSIREKLETRFGIKLTGINFREDVKRGDGYDVCFWVSDGSIPNLKARKNFLHFQVPFMNINGTTLINKFKLMRVNKIIVNSKFTKKIIDKEFGVDSFVLYPPVAVNDFKPKKKENIILNVARFSTLLQSKGQEVLIKAFKKFEKSNPDYKLILAGGVEIGADENLKKLEKEIEGFPIEIIKSPDFRSLKDLYGKAKIFWSASGHEIDEKKEPQKVEHFGITAVEAMAAGAIPIICNSGGYKEIIGKNSVGFLWNDIIELNKFTKKVVNDERLRKKIASSAVSHARMFSYETFEESFSKLCS